MGNTETRPKGSPAPLRNNRNRGSIGNLVKSLSDSLGIQRQRELVLPDEAILNILSHSLHTFRLTRQLSRHWYQISFTLDQEFHLCALVRITVPVKGGFIKQIPCKMSDTISHLHDLVQNSGIFGKELTIEQPGYFFPSQMKMDGKWLDFNTSIKDSKIGWSPYLEYKSKLRKLSVNVANVWKNVQINDGDTVGDIAKAICKLYKLPAEAFSLFIPKGPFSILLQEQKTLHGQDWEITLEDELLLDESPWDSDEQRQIISRSLPLKILYNNHKSGWLRGLYEAAVETAIYLAALILQISLGPYHEEMELWKPKQVLPPQFCDRYHRRILIPVYEKYSEFRTMATASAQRKFVNVTFQLPRTAYFRCMERGLIANHVALGLNREHIIRGDPKTLKPLTLWPWDEIDEDDNKNKKSVWRWEELLSWNQHGSVITLDLPDVGRLELTSNCANEISVHLEKWVSKYRSNERRKFEEIDESQSDTLGSWESLDEKSNSNLKPKAQIIVKTEGAAPGLAKSSQYIDDVSSDSSTHSSEEFVFVAPSTDLPQVEKEVDENDIIEFTSFV